MSLIINMNNRWWFRWVEKNHQPVIQSCIWANYTLAKVTLNGAVVALKGPTQERSPPDAPSCAKELFFRWSWIQPFLHIGSYVFESLQIGWKQYQSVFSGTVAGACASWWTYINDFCLGEGPGQIGIWFIPSHIMSRRQPESVWSPKSMKRSWNPSSCGMVGMNSFFHSQKWLPKVMPTP